MELDDVELEMLIELEGLMLSNAKAYDTTVKELEAYFLKTDLCICAKKKIVDRLKTYWIKQGKTELENRLKQ